MDYADFIAGKSQTGKACGFEPLWLCPSLFDFQRHLTEWAIRRGRAAIYAECGLGKAQRVDQRILTPEGWREIGSVRVGSRVYGSDGKPHDVVGVYPQGVKKMAKVSFSDGTSVICDWDHLWYVQSQLQRYQGRSGKVMTTSAIAAKGIRYAGGQAKHFVPLPLPLEFRNRRDHLIDPYTLGVVLGDGCLVQGTCKVTCPDFAFTADEMPLPSGCSWSVFNRDGHCREASIVGGRRNSVNPFTSELKRMGLWGHRSESKFVPDEYLYSSPQVRHAVIQGLLDTDGHACGPCIEFSTASPKMSDDMVFMVRSLGGTATQSREKAHYTKGVVRVECQDKFRSVIKLPSSFSPFRLKRKAESYAPIQRQEPHKTIVGIADAGEGEAVCIAVNASDHLYITEGMTLTHNTVIQLVWAENVVRKTNKPVLILTPLSVGPQTVGEAGKFGMAASVSAGGSIRKAGVYITNYEKLHKFNSSDFAGAVGDEAGILKDFDSKTRDSVVEFTRTMPYRLLCTATPAPNDYVELGNSAECLGEMGFQDMATMFFKKETSKDYLGWGRTKYRMRPHAARDFWRWVCSWSRAIRKPSDLGYDDRDFILPPLHINEHVVSASLKKAGMLFDVPAMTLQDQQEEARRTIPDRCAKAAEIINSTSRPAVAWCNLNDEGDLLERLIPGSAQISGSTDEDRREAILSDFVQGRLRVLVTKQELAGYGLNWQHCAHQTHFVNHSYERWHQSVRRSYRFGQKSPVTVDVICTPGTAGVRANLQRKTEAADAMFANIVSLMSEQLNIERRNPFVKKSTVPAWLAPKGA